MPLSIYQIPLKNRLIQAEFHPRNNSVFALYANGELGSISPAGKENIIFNFDCEPVAFRINATGDLIALLGKGKLYFCNLLTLNSAGIDVDEKIQLLEFYKDSALLSGFQKNILLIKQNGSVIKDIGFDFLIRQFKPVPATGNLIIYGQDLRLIYTDTDGKILWQIENLIIHKKIQIAEGGHIGYFLLNPNDLIQFSVHGDAFFDIGDECTVKSFLTSRDGNRLLVLDSENELAMFDKTGQKLWKYNPEHSIDRMGLSPKGDLFFAVDSDDVLSCYTTDSNSKNRRDFIEISDEKRVLVKEAAWTIRPGGFSRTACLRELTVSPDARLFGLVGLDGCIYFCDEQGKILYHTPFTSIVKHIGISNNSGYGYVYGGNEILIADIQNDKKKLILFKKKLPGIPVVNFHRKKIFTITGERELLIYGFEGPLLDTIPLKKEYQGGISCENHGIVLYNREEIKGFSGSGKALFDIPLASEVTGISYGDHFLLCSLRDNSVFRMDLSCLKGKIKTLKVKEGNSGILSADPFLFVAGDKSLHHLDSDLSVIRTYAIESPDSLFFREHDRCYEILKSYNGFYCYNDKREMIWRYSSEDRIVESALMRYGLVFTTENSVRYLGLRNRGESGKDFSQYLEI